MNNDDFSSVRIVSNEIRERCLERFESWVGVKLNRIMWQKDLKLKRKRRPKNLPKQPPMRLRFDPEDEDD